jgi:hypothetical protein
VNLANVVEIGIGLAGLDGGLKADTMRFDDIRVYTGRCIPAYGQPYADLNNDCRVDIADVEVLIDSWGVSLPEPWSSMDIAASDGSTVVEDGTFTITGEGADIWGNSDQFRYVYQRVSGDCEISARVAEIGPGSNGWAKAGVMMRETLNADSKHMIMALTASEGGGIAFQGRQQTGGASTSFHGDITAAPPTWVKLTRVGNSITAYYSANGVDWSLMTDTSPDGAHTNPINVAMGDIVYVGLAVTSHADGELRTAKFDNVNVIGGTDVGPVDLNRDGAVGWPDLFLLLDEWLVEQLWPY